MENLTIIDHPLIQHKLTEMRKKHTSSNHFRTLLKEISLLLAYEITRNLPMETISIETPLEKYDAPTLAGKKLALMSYANDNKIGVNPMIFFVLVGNIFCNVQKTFPSLSRSFTP